MIVLDTTVLVYAVGGAHPLAAPCQRLIDLIGDGQFAATTTAQVIQEFVHVRARRRDRRDAVEIGSRFVALLTPLLPVGEEDLADGMRLFERVDGLGAFDAVLAAAAINADAEALVSADRAFSRIRRLPSIEPGTSEFDALLGSS